MKCGGDKRKYIIGLTGSSGSGKSTAAKILSELGATVIDADKIAYETVEKETVLDELKNAFGDWVTDERGGYNRKKISEIAFTDKAFLARLSAITHRHIVKEIYARVDGIASSPADKPSGGVIVIDAPIPVERGFLDLADAVWVVSARREARTGRIVKRDGIGEAETGARFDSQMSDADYERLADVIIRNDDDMEAFKTTIKRYFSNIPNEIKP